MHDEKLSELISLGDGAELLHQPDLLTYFQTSLQAMSEFNLPIVHQIQDALVEVKASNQYRQCSHFCRIS